MLYTINLNPAIDKTMYLREFQYGKTNRPYRVVEDGAGKAINAAIVLAELGNRVGVIGLSHADGGIIRTRLEELHIPYDFLEAEGRTRVNIKIFDESKQTVTEINEPGGREEEKNLEAVAAKIYATAQTGDMVILTGRLPDGCRSGYYAELVRDLKTKGVRCVLDASGDALRQGIQARPYFIKPNKDELCELYGAQDANMHELAKMAVELADTGIRYVMVSMGGEGALLTNGLDVLYAQAPQVEVKSTVGAGDSMLAAAAVLLDNNMEKALQSGVAAATASCVQEGTRLMNRLDYQKFLDIIKVKIL